VSAPWLECFIYAFPDAKIADMKCFATSPDRRTVVGARHQSLFFFDVPTVQMVSDCFDLSEYVQNIECLEFSPDGKFVFFGRLDKWFSVERSCVEDFPQFSGNCQSYEWGMFDSKMQCIVVKRGYFSGLCPDQTCLFKLLSLWAKMEIEQSRDDEMTVGFCLQVLYNESSVHEERVSHRLEVQKYLDKTRQHREYHPTCWYCRRLEAITRSNQQPSLARVRELVIELYSFIFGYQVWDFQTGMSVIQQLFSEGIQLSPFKYLCHVTCAFSEYALEMGCTGIEEAMSICNIAVVNAFFCRDWFLSERRSELDCRLELEWSNFRQEEERSRLIAQLGGLERELKAFSDLTQELKQEWKLVMNLQLDPERYHLHSMRKAHSLKVRLTRPDWKGLHNSEKMQLLQKARRCELTMEQKRKGQRMMSAELKEVLSEEFKVGVRTNTREGFQHLVYDVNAEIRICVSAEAKWIEAGDVPTMHSLQTGNQDPHFDNDGNPKTVIGKFRHITFTNDGLHCVFSSDSSVKALSLQTGTVLTSVSGRNLIYFAGDRQVGYLFHSDTEERIILLTSLFNPFKLIKNVDNSSRAMFRSSVLSVSSYSKITSWVTTTNEEGIPFICESLKEPGVQSPPMKNFLLSSDGALIAIHQETKVELYSFAGSTRVKKFVHTVYESKCEFTVLCFAFSADSTLLLFCIQDSRSYPHLYVWDVQQKVTEASLQSGLLTIECCCFSWDKRLAILCGDYEVEIVEYAGDTHQRLEVEIPYGFVKFAQCTVSLDNQLLACCIANRILIYDLLASNINSSKQVLRGHLGRIEFCRFLKANRYLISYGVDGMVFLWEMSELKAIAFARITQGNENIVAIAFSPKEDIAVCFTSSDRVYEIKLCGLDAVSSLKPLTSPLKGKLETAESSLRIPRQIASTSTEYD